MWTEYRKEHVVKVNCVNIKRWYSRVLLLSSEIYSQRFSLQCTCFVQHNKRRREEEQLQCFLKQAEYPACTKNRILIVAKAFQSLLCTPLSPLAIYRKRTSYQYFNQPLLLPDEIANESSSSLCFLKGTKEEITHQLVVLQLNHQQRSRRLVIKEKNLIIPPEPSHMTWHCVL